MNPAPQQRVRKRRFWRLCRIYFRRFRITVWLIALMLLGSLVYLNQVGLPGFVKKPVLQKLRTQGIDLRFSRLRLRFYQGIIADNVQFGRPDDPASPQLRVKEVQVGLNLKALTRRQLQIDDLHFRQGRLVWPVPAQGATPARELVLENIQSQLRFLPGDQWALDNFTADFIGARIHLSSSVTNASAVRDWTLFRSQESRPSADRLWEKRIHRLADTLQRIRFSAPPELHLDIAGDACDLSSFGVRMVLNAPGAHTPWGRVDQGRFFGRIFAADQNGTSRAELQLEAGDAQTPWASITNFQCSVKLSGLEGRTNVVEGELQVTAACAETKWASGSNVVVKAEWVHSITNPVPLSGRGQVHCAAATTQWGTARAVELTSRLSRPEDGTVPAADASWAWWTNIQPYALAWDCVVKGLNSPRLAADEISSAGTWQAPQLRVTNLVARLYGGTLDLDADLDVASRALQANLKSDVDPHRLAPALTEGAQKWLKQYSWNGPPQVQGQIALVLPAWTNREPDWRSVQPSLRLDGEFNIPAGGSHKQVTVTSARSHFSYSNLCWHLPDLILTRPEGQVRASHRANDANKDFYWRLSSNIDVRALRHLLDPEAQKGFDLLQLSQPPIIDAEIWGCSRAPERTGFRGEITLTNFSFRGQSATRLQTALQYTNKVLQIFQPHIERDVQQMRAEGLTADFNRELVYLTNGFSTAEPMVIARALGPKVAKAIEAYVFFQPPTAYVNGTIPMHGEEGADLHFQLEGGPFHWWKFNVPWIAGHVHWAGKSLSLTNMRTDFYHGKAAGSAHFDFRAAKGANFTFSVTTADALVEALMADLSTKTNHLEGRLNGTVNVTQGNTEDWTTLFGYGNFDLRDGLIWDIPLFGIFTPVLNSLVPGLGNIRATSGTCTYVMTAGVLRSEDLEIRAPALRLQYRGTVDLESRLNARVEAEMLRDMWVVGPLVSTVLWPVTKMFEYKVTGTLDEPKMEPVYIIPKLVLLPFHPFRTLKSLLTEPAAPKTNSPAPPKP